MDKMTDTKSTVSVCTLYAILSQSDNLSSSYEEEALGPKEFKEVTEVLGKSTKKLHRMGILTGIVKSCIQKCH